MSDDPCLPQGRLEPFDDNESSCGAVAAANYASCPSYPVGHSDGARSPKLGDSVDSGHPGFPDLTLPYDLNGDGTVYGNTATLFPEYFFSHMNKQYSILSSPPSFGHDAAQAIGLYTPRGQGLTSGVMSIVGVWTTIREDTVHLWRLCQDVHSHSRPRPTRPQCSQPCWSSLPSPRL